MALGFLFAGLALFGDLWILISGRQDPFLHQAEGAAPQWIVVPGASVHRDGTLSPILRDRMEKALEAARAWPRSRVLLSGTSIAGGYSEPEAMRKWISAQGISSDRIVLDRAGFDTKSTIEHLGPPSGDIVIVSQDWHLPRALWRARAEGWSARGLIASQEGWGLRYRLREHLVRALYFFTP